MTVTTPGREGHVACMGKTKLLVSKPGGKSPLGTLKHIWVAHI